jgi:hypothetical protein
MGILLLILGVFIIMGGIQVLSAGLLGLTVIGAFVISSMLVGKVLFKLLSLYSLLSEPSAKLQRICIRYQC